MLVKGGGQSGAMWHSMLLTHTGQDKNSSHRLCCPSLSVTPPIPPPPAIHSSSFQQVIHRANKEANLLCSLWNVHCQKESWNGGGGLPRYLTISMIKGAELQPPFCVWEQLLTPSISKEINRRKNGVEIHFQMWHKRQNRNSPKKAFLLLTVIKKKKNEKQTCKLIKKIFSNI